jgi:hypothetical protein
MNPLRDTSPIHSPGTLSQDTSKPSTKIQVFCNNIENFSTICGENFSRNNIEPQRNNLEHNHFYENNNAESVGGYFGTPSDKSKKVSVLSESSRSEGKIGEKGLSLRIPSGKNETQVLQNANNQILRLNNLLSDHNQRIADLENLIGNRNQSSCQ